MLSEQELVNKNRTVRTSKNVSGLVSLFNGCEVVRMVGLLGLLGFLDYIRGVFYFIGLPSVQSLNFSITSPSHASLETINISSHNLLSITDKLKLIKCVRPQMPNLRDS